MKQRTGTESPYIMDSVRGPTNVVRTNSTDAQSSPANMVSSFDSDGWTMGSESAINATSREDPNQTQDLLTFDSDGFSIGTDNSCNESGNTIVAWDWKAGGGPTTDNVEAAGATPTAGSVKIDGSNLGSALAGTIAATRLSANTTSGFSIVKYTGTGSLATVAHGLSQAPELIIVKQIPTSSNWAVGATPVYSGWTGRAGELNSTGAKSSSSDYWDDTPPSPSVFTIGTELNVNESGDELIAYIFHSVEGYSKVGSYEGNGNLDGTFVYTGFSPAFVMTKSVDSTSDWQMFDNKRVGYNVDNYELEANDVAAEDTSTEFIDIVSNGFKNRDTTDPNVAETYLYIAFAESPFKYSNAR